MTTSGKATNYLNNLVDALTSGQRTVAEEILYQLGELAAAGEYPADVRELAADAASSASWAPEWVTPAMQVRDSVAAEPPAEVIILSQDEIDTKACRAFLSEDVAERVLASINDLSQGVGVYTLHRVPVWKS